MQYWKDRGYRISQLYKMDIFCFRDFIIDKYITKPSAVSQRCHFFTCKIQRAMAPFFSVGFKGVVFLHLQSLIDAALKFLRILWLTVCFTNEGQRHNGSEPDIWGLHSWGVLATAFSPLYVERWSWSSSYCEYLYLSPIWQIGKQIMEKNGEGLYPVLWTRG